MKKYRYKWLYRYIRGKGGYAYLPQDLVKAILPSLACAYVEAQESRCTQWDGDREVIPFRRTTLYSGCGFFNRPEMFYMVGCFTFALSYIGDKVIVSGQDVYDWHPTAQGDWFCSPLPIKTAGLAKAIAFVLGAIFGRDCFPLKGFPSEKPSISNKFWAGLERFGARPFTTIFRCHFVAEEWDEAVEEAYGYRYGGYDA